MSDVLTQGFIFAWSLLGVAGFVLSLKALDRWLLNRPRAKLAWPPPPLAEGFIVSEIKSLDECMKLGIPTTRLVEVSLSHSERLAAIKAHREGVLGDPKGGYR